MTCSSEACVRALGQQRHVQASSSPPTQETFHPSLGDQDLLEDSQRAAGPARQDDVRVEGDRGQAELQTLHGLIQPLNEYGDNRSGKQDGAQND